MRLSDVVIVALITTTPPTILSAASFITAWRGSTKVEAVAVQVEEVHKATNSMKDELVRATKSAALLKGHADGVKDEKVRSAEERKK